MSIWSPKIQERKHALSAAAEELADAVQTYVEACGIYSSGDYFEEFRAMSAALERYREIQKS